MWGGLDSSCPWDSTKKIKLISLGVWLNKDILNHGKPWQFRKRIESVINSYLLLFFLILSLIIAFLFLMISHFPPLLASFTFWTSFPSSTWSSGMEYSFVKIPDTFRLGDLLTIYTLCSLQLNLTHINRCLCSSSFPTLCAFIRDIVWIFDLYLSCYFTTSKVSSPFLLLYASNYKVQDLLMVLMI